MKVLFLENVLHVWKKWDIKEVKPWYASNMLIPKKLAIELTPFEEKQYLKRKQQDEKNRRQLLENRYDIIDRITWSTLKFSLHTSNNGKVFWSIAEKDIIESIKQKFKIDLTKKHIDMPDWHIKKVWEFQIYIKLGKDSMAKIKIVVDKN